MFDPVSGSAILGECIDLPSIRGWFAVMSIPDFQSLFRPLLSYAQDGSEKRVSDAVAALAKEFKLSDEELNALLPSRRQTVFANRVHWAKAYLKQAGAIQQARRSYFSITERGRKLLADHPACFDVAVLKQFPEFTRFYSAKGSDDQLDETASVPSQPDTQQVDATPEEAIQLAAAQISDSLRSQLLERVGELSPAFFERLVTDLIVAMGYGGSRESVVQRLGKSGDEGIDGVVNEDPLGLDVVYIQAKRYAPDNTMGRERIQQFAGALVGQGAAKGVFVTTSSFSRGAVEYAQRVPQRIILIDGAELGRLMIQYGVGVRTERKIELKRLDIDYFEEADD